MNSFYFFLASISATVLLEAFFYDFGFMLFCNEALRKDFQGTDEQWLKFLFRAFFLMFYTRALFINRGQHSYMLNGYMWKPWFKFYKIEGIIYDNKAITDLERNRK